MINQTIFNMKYLMVFITILAISSCSSGKKEDKTKNPNEALLNEVIAIHDSAMAKMGTITQYQKQIKESMDSATVDSIKIEVYAQLEQAHDGMMEWMRDFSEKFPSGKIMGGDMTGAGKGKEDGNERSLEEEKKLLEGLKESAQKMSYDIDKSLENAQKLMNKEVENE